MPRNKKKFPKYIDVYNDVLKLMRDGFYPEGSKLPTEEELAVRMNVSRMTLRQALQLLKEDGMIEAVHGSGNYVRKISSQDEIGIEEKGNPMRKICSREIQDMEILIQLRPTVEYTDEIFGRKTSVALDINRIYKDGNGVAGYSVSTILSDVLDEFELDLNRKEELTRFLETDIYEEAHRVRIEMKVLPESAGQKRGGVSSLTKTYLILFEQDYDQGGRLLVYTKHYIAVEDAKILLNWRND